MKTNDPEIQNGVVSVLAERYALHTEEIGFIPVGEESISYKVTAQDGRCYFAKYCRQQKIIRQLPSVHRLLLQLRDLDFVIPPVVASRRTEFDLGDGKVYVFPFVEGEIIARANETMEEDLVSEITGLMAQIHKCTAKGNAALPLEKFDSLYRERRTLARLKTRTRKADEDLKSLFAESERSLEAVLERQEAEADRYRHRSVDLVLTHGDITGRNMIRTAAGLKLVDWDEAMLAPAERDINFFYDNPHFSLERYYECVGKDRSLFDRRLMEYYGRHWLIESILENFAKLLGPLPDDHRQEYMDELEGYIDCCRL